MIYKASFRNNTALEMSSGCNNKKCVLLVSVGQKYHEGEKLSATIDLINRFQFGLCHIIVADSLQRYNFIGDSIAYQKAMHLGDRWISDNQDIINKLHIPFEIIRWDYWLGCQEYQSHRKFLDFLYCSNVSCKKAIDNTAQQFISRYSLRRPDVFINNKEKIFSNCLEYLLEECTIISSIWAKIGYDFIIYPKPLTPALEATRNIITKDNYKDKIIWLSLMFKKYNTGI